jgi:hypothetical protein
MPAQDLAGDWSRMRGIKPRTYVCRRASAPIKLDGRLDDAAWRDAAWTEDFIDIEGDRKPKPRFRTRARMLWDDDFLYVAAELEEPHVVATLTERNSIVFHDNDFEIFIDPDGDNHHYYEFEVNAFNTLFELTLPKPYKDGGRAQHGTNLPGLRSAIAIDGTINEASDSDRGWTLEVALPWKSLAEYQRRGSSPPGDGDIWRINFSRVQWIYDVIDGKYRRRDRATNPEDNWVWSPQGIVDMHRPERWGLVLFTSEEPSKQVEVIDPSLPARELLMEAYYRQRAFRDANGRWARSLTELGADSTCIVMTTADDGFTISTEFATSDRHKRRANIREDSLIWFDDEK